MCGDRLLFINTQFIITGNRIIDKKMHKIEKTIVINY